MSTEVPQWLVQAFVRSVQAAGSAESKEEIASVCRSLIGRWTTSDRSHHGVTHLIYVLTRLETLLPEAREPDLVRLAAWYHGACFSTAEEDAYTHNGGENEAESAKVAEAELASLGVAPEKTERIGTLIRALGPQVSSSTQTLENTHAFDLDEQTLRDAHLGTLAVEPQRYKNYVARVAEEYAHIPRHDFLLARRQIVSRLLSRKQLFLTPLARQWDEPARENLAAELERLNNSLEQAELTAVNPSEAVTRENPTPAEEDLESPGAAAPETSVPETSGVSSSGTDSSVTLGDEDQEDLSQASALEEVPTPEADDPAPTGTFDSILIASEEEEPAPEAPHREEQLPAGPAPSAESSDTLSSLESCAESVEPGSRPVAPSTPEAARKARRNQIAEEMRQRIEQRHQAADTMRMSRIEAELPNTPASAETAKSATTAASANSPDSSAPHRVSAWERVKEGASADEDAENLGYSPTHGIEREPDV
ncbi:hypothetical protein [Ancrocorticia populi]|uniref:HD domain-containing protein n=1 Tax=Ancrocorticia populi TaxID=2175228 RepID=UPI003F91DFF6